MEERNQKNLGLISLIALVVGAMIGSGIFSIPQNAAAEAGVTASIIAWIITAFGMLNLTFVFMDLSKQRPDLDAGVYAYAKEGFGNLIGFFSAWGYWFTGVLGNVIYMVLMFSTFSYFFPTLNFGMGNTFNSIFFSSLLLWTIHYMISIGIKQATYFNIITTISKIVPILLFIVICLFNFDFDIFKINFWSLGKRSIFEQVKGMMIVTVWVFIGIEGASIFSNRAKNRKDIANATIIGFLFVLSLLMMVNIVSFGVMERSNLANLRNPSTSYILEHVIGQPGMYMMSIGLILSLFGAMLAWILFAAEILYQGAMNRTFPSFLRVENDKDVPINSLFLSSMFVQLFLIITYFSKETYTSLLYLATSMILLPYFFSAVFGFKYSLNKKRQKKILLFYFLAVFYSIWLIYAAGLKYLFLSSILYSLGIPFYLLSYYEYSIKTSVLGKFERKEYVLLFLMISLSFYGMYSLYMGYLSL